MDRLRERTTEEVCGELIEFLNETEKPEALMAQISGQKAGLSLLYGLGFEPLLTQRELTLW